MKATAAGREMGHARSISHALEVSTVAYCLQKMQTMMTAPAPTPAAPASRTIFRIVIGLILVWGAYLIIGAFMQRPARAVVLAVCFAGFLGFWWAAFQLRKRRMAREAKAGEEEE